MNLTIRILSILILSFAAISCIEDGVSSSQAHQPDFSTDTLNLGPVFTGQPTPTYSFRVYNRHSKVISISQIAVRGGDKTFRLNVDGRAGSAFSNVEIRPNDSIFVFVEATVPPVGGVEPKLFTGHIDFITQGVQRSVVLAAMGRDVEVMRGRVVTSDEVWTSGGPRQVLDSLVIAQGATLTLSPGVELLFHDKATLEVHGRLISQGSAEQPVVMTGDRTDNVVADIPFDVMASQWGGVNFHHTSGGSRLEHTVIKNMTQGVWVDSVAAPDAATPGLYIRNSRIRNAAGYSFASWFSDIRAVGTEFSDAALTPLLIVGGSCVMNHCTVANYYLFAPIAYPLVNLSHFNAETDAGNGMPYLRADFSNCIFYGLGQDINAGNFDDTDIFIRSCAFKSEGSDDDHFIACTWGVDPLYRTVREEYLFDYRLLPESPLTGSADPALTLAEASVDFYGTERTSTPTHGAFQFVP